MNNINHQRGVALLFALGILSLILVSGLAFLGNSLISQKVAFNHQEQASAKFLARSAAERAIAHLTMFNVIQAGHHADYYVSDASSVFSRLSSSPVTPVGETSSDRTQDQLESGSANNQKTGLTKSKLSVGNKKFGGNYFPWYSGTDSFARWIYVHEEGAESDGSGDTVSKPIVGRYAYQVLPATSTSRLSLYALTKGAYSNLHPVLGALPTEMKMKSAKLYRWGIDVDELLIDHPLFSSWGNAGGAKAEADTSDLSQREFDTFFNIHSGKEGPLYLADNANDTDKKNVELQKRWVKNIFTEGMGRGIREAYPGNSAIPFNQLRTWHPRFNLGDFKPFFEENETKERDGIWYSRFRRPQESGDSAGAEKSDIEALKNGKKNPDSGKTVLDYLAGDTMLSYMDNYVSDRDDDKVIGLPFLRRIGHNDEKGGFSKIEYLRKQIAANLNDYCDADSIPTSDVPANEWKDAISDESKVPQYTGNEKTPYINEVAFGFRLKDAKFETQGGSYLFKAAPFEAELLAELISVYKGVALESSTKLYSRVKSLSVTFSVSFTADAQGSYNDGDTVKNVSGSVGETTKQLKVDFPVDQDVEIKFSGDSLVGNGPYWIGGSQKIKRDGDLSVDFTDKVKEAMGCADQTLTALTVNLKTASIKIDKVAFNLGHLALTQGEDNVGIDFVKFDSTAEREIPFAEDARPVVFESTSNVAAQLADATGGDKGIFYCGGMQVFDPRQNLNANKTADRKNDWYLTEEKPTFTETTDKNAWKWDYGSKLSDRISGGAVNTYSNPKTISGVLGADSGSTAQPRDIETAEDPAWQGDADGKHISTAVIRNAPMRSSWELGFIHRGIPFQTINLKKTGGIDGFGELADEAHGSIDCSKWDVAEGTKYSSGDAGILDQIKMTEYNKSYGKIDLSVLKVDSPFWSMGMSVESHNQKLFLGLFNKVEKYTAQKFLELSEGTSYVKKEHTPSDDYIPYSNSIWTAFKSIPDSMRRSRLLGPCSNSQDDLSANLTAGSNDAAQEQLIGRTFNLIEGQSVSLPNTFQIIVVAQSIRDLSGEIVRLKNNGKTVKCSDSSDQGGLGGREAALGRFDANIGSNEKIYFDEIRSECRMLVTVEKVHYMADEGSGKVPRSRLRVKQIEYLD